VVSLQVILFVSAFLQFKLDKAGVSEVGSQQSVHSIEEKSSFGN
jgi:hypothetical protein